MKKILLILFTVCSPLIAQEAKVTTLMVKPLPDFPGKDVQMFTVEYPPGSHDPIHRHNAHGFIYVLEGSFVMAVNDGQPVTLTAGQTFYEGPTIFTPLVATRARRHLPGSWCSCSKTKMRLF
ncbi:MAG TPA: cupin domain-containing protein [Acidobacteriaceae bacterium]|jgi:quercetin dioxygenase-like cupin family protein